MRIALYAPLKTPDHPVPSGDRRMARGLMAAMELAGHEVAVASRHRSWAAVPDDQGAIRDAGLAEARRLAARYRADAAARPDLWFTYHLYYRAPDWIGPYVARALDIPYAVAEASFAMKRAGGEWAMGHDQTELALRTASVVFSLKAGDVPGLRKARGLTARLVPLPPFLDAAPDPDPERVRAERVLIQGEADSVVLLAVGMMRTRAKLDSYRHLAAALARLADRKWVLAIAGDGEARSEVEAAFAGFASGRVRYLGALSPERLEAAYAAADVLVWPGLGEAYGMTYLEAQAAGLPVVATRAGGVANVVADGVSGLLVGSGDPADYAAGIARLLDDPDLRRALGSSARAFARGSRSLRSASAVLDAALRPLVSGSS